MSRYTRKYFSLIGILVICTTYNSPLWCQVSITDSLNKILEKTNNDTTRCNLLCAITENETDPAVWIPFNNQLRSICEEKLSSGSIGMLEQKVYKRSLASVFNNLGILAKGNGELIKALENYKKCLQLMEELGDKTSVAITLNNIAVIYKTSGDIPKTLEYLEKSLRLLEQTGNAKGMQSCLNNIGAIHADQGHFDEAMQYYNKALISLKKDKDARGQAYILGNIAFIHYKKGDIHKAIELHEQCLEMQLSINDKSAIANTYFYLGQNYESIQEFLKAIEYYQKSLNLNTELNNMIGISNSSAGLGSILIEKKEYDKALVFCQQALHSGLESGSPECTSKAALYLYLIYKKKNDYEKAYENYTLHIKMYDSIANESNRKASIKQQLKYEYEKQAAADSVEHSKASEIKNVELAKQKAEIKAKNNQQFALFGGLGLVLIFAGFMFNRFKVTQKQKIVIEHQKEIVEEQKKLVEEKQKEVIDSITYAKRIQLAQIPTEKRVYQILDKLKKS